MKSWELPKSSSWTLGLFTASSQTLLLIYEAAYQTKSVHCGCFRSLSLMIDDAEVFKVFFAISGCSQASQVPVTVWGSEALPTVNGKETTHAISKLDMRKCGTRWDAPSSAWGNCPVSLQGHSLSCLKVVDNQGSFLISGKRQKSHLHLKKGKKENPSYYKLSASHSWKGY